jgi:2-polyprenyl-3-methyl-5-hydroxy-6-metoxy-1,4-benzoquinol methylase
VTAADPPADGYALRLTDAEIGRYRMMAEQARTAEADLWRLAGIGPGARVADLGCGPGALLPALAAEVGPTGHVTGVDGDPAAVGAATAYAAENPLWTSTGDRRARPGCRPARWTW